MRSSDLVPTLVFGHIRSRGLRALMSVAVAIVGAAFAALVIFAVVHRQWLVALIVAAITVVSAGLFVVVTCVRRSDAVGAMIDRRAAGVDGSTVRYAARHRWTVVAVCWSVVIVSWFVGFSGRHGQVTLIGAVIAAVVTVSLRSVLLGRITDGHVRLTRSGIEHKGYSFVATIGWDEIGSVYLAYPHLPLLFIDPGPGATARARHVITSPTLDGQPPGRIRIDCRFIDVHPEALCSWIRFYVDYPAARVELGTDGAWDRLTAWRPTTVPT